MKNTLVQLLIFSSAAFAACSSSPKNAATSSAVPVASTVASTSSSSTPSPGGFHLRDYKLDKWDNGLQVISVENHALPSISFGLLVKDGATSDSMTKSGLMRLMAQVMVRGTDKMSGPQLADALGLMGSEMDVETSDDYMWFQLTGLTPYTSKLLDVFSEVILKPRFDAKEIEREKGITLSAIKERPDHPDQFAGQAFDSYLFGGHPYARPVAGFEADVKSISRKDVIRAYTHFIRPNNSILVVTGDITPEVIASLKARFGSWSKRDIETPVYAQPPVFHGVNIRVVDKPDLTQSHILIGQRGIARNDPDYLNLRIANIILGGNFSSRLMEQIRVNLGLTYGISSSFDAQLDRGAFEISTFTRNSSVANTIEQSLKVFRKFISDGVSDDEVDSAKNFLVGQFPRAIETSERLGFNLALLRLFQIGDDYLQNFVVNVNAVTTKNVNEAIKRHLGPDDLKILVLTNGKEALEQLRTLGLLEVKKVSDSF